MNDGNYFEEKKYSVFKNKSTLVGVQMHPVQEDQQVIANNTTILFYDYTQFLLVF